MKKMLNCSFAYAIAAMVGGVFFREFTKFNGFTGVTTLGKLHTHLFMLGMVVFLLAALFSLHLDLEANRKWKAFLVVYNIGVPLTALMMLVRGVAQVLALPLSKGMDAALSGMAGVGHILTGVGLVLFLFALKSSEKRVAVS